MFIQIGIALLLFIFFYMPIRPLLLKNDGMAYDLRPAPEADAQTKRLGFYATRQKCTV